MNKVVVLVSFVLLGVLLAGCESSYVQPIDSCLNRVEQRAVEIEEIRAEEELCQEELRKKLTTVQPVRADKPCTLADVSGKYDDDLYREFRKSEEKFTKYVSMDAYSEQLSYYCELKRPKSIELTTMFKLKTSTVLYRENGRCRAKQGGSKETKATTLLFGWNGYAAYARFIFLDIVSDLTNRRRENWRELDEKRYFAQVDFYYALVSKHAKEIDGEYFRKIMVDIVENEEFLGHLTEWGTEIFPVIVPPLQSESNTWLTDLWQASTADLPELKSKVVPPENATEEQVEEYGEYLAINQLKLEGMFLRRWMAKGEGQVGDDYIVLLRSRIALVANPFIIHKLTSGSRHPDWRSLGPRL